MSPQGAYPRLPPEYRRLAKFAAAHGWRVERVKGGHLRWINPQGRDVPAASTPSDNRDMQNLVAMLRRAGLPVPRKGAPKSEWRKPPTPPG